MCVHHQRARIGEFRLLAFDRRKLGQFLDSVLKIIEFLGDSSGGAVRPNMAVPGLEQVERPGHLRIRRHIGPLQFG